MKKKLLKINTLFLLASFLLLSGCSNNTTNVDSRWNLTEEDSQNMVEGDAFYSVEDNKSIFHVTYFDPIVTRSLTNDDVKIINRSKVEPLIADDSNSIDYIDDSIISQYSIVPEEISCNEDLNDLTISFTPTETSDEFSLLINKDVTECGNYILLDEYVAPTAGTYFDSQAEFEKKYVSEEFNWNNGGSFIVNMLLNTATIVGGVGFGSPTSILAGINSMLLCIGNTFCSPEGVDIASMINTLDEKLDNITASMNRNFSQLKEQNIQTQLQIDTSILNQHQEAINSFNQNYLYKIDDFNTTMKNAMSVDIKNIVNGGSKELDLYFYKDDKDQWNLSTIADQDPATMSKVAVYVGDFTNAKNNLSLNKQVIKEGFSEELEKDLQAACSSIDCFDGLTTDDLVKSCYANFMEGVVKDYFTSNPGKATELEVLVKNECKVLYGAGIGAKGVVDNYIERLPYMYNFAGEVKPVLTTILAKLLEQLDAATTMAAMALNYQEIDTDPLKNEFKNAREYIQNSYKSKADVLADNYSYQAGSKLQGKFYEFYYYASYDNLGNHPTLYVNTHLNTLHYNERTNSFYINFNDDVKTYNWVDATTLRKIGCKFTLLKNLSLVDANTDFTTYLSNNGAIESDAILAYEHKSIDSKKKAYYNRIFTGITNERNLNSGDTSYRVKCTAQGNPGGSYFSLNSIYNYANHRNKNRWSGHLAETEYVDGITGTMRNDTYLGLWADYSESHWNWSNDEYWALTGLDEVGETDTCFFGIQKVN